MSDPRWLVTFPGHIATREEVEEVRREWSVSDRPFVIGRGIRLTDLETGRSYGYPDTEPQWNLTELSSERSVPVWLAILTSIVTFLLGVAATVILR